MAPVLGCLQPHCLHPLESRFPLCAVASTCGLHLSLLAEGSDLQWRQLAVAAEMRSPCGGRLRLVLAGWRPRPRTWRGPRSRRRSRRSQCMAWRPQTAGHGMAMRASPPLALFSARPWRRSSTTRRAARRVTLGRRMALTGVPNWMPTPALRSAIAEDDHAVAGHCPTSGMRIFCAMPFMWRQWRTRPSEG